MKPITKENCINLIKETFPGFIPYWEDHIKAFGPDLDIPVDLLPFGLYAINIIKSNNDELIKKIFNFVELLLVNGDEIVQEATTTEFLEFLMNIDPKEIQFNKIVQYLGPKTLAYCRAWDEFTGVRTEGLWDN